MKASEGVRYPRHFRGVVLVEPEDVVQVVRFVFFQRNLAGEIPPKPTVGVCNGSPLPGRVRVAKVGG